MKARLLGASVLLLTILGGWSRGEDSDDAKPPFFRDPLGYPSGDAINRAIDAGVAWLLANQLPDGSWGPCESGRTYSGGPGGLCYPSGPTSFSLFTLAACGVQKRDRAIRRGLKWLRSALRRQKYITSYEFASAVLALTELNRAGDRPPSKLMRPKGRLIRPAGSRFTRDEWRLMCACVERLGACMQAQGGFGYWPNRREIYADVSATQFAALALRAASFAGYPVEWTHFDVWKKTARYHIELQDPSGGFPYRAGGAWMAGTTAAGISTLLICQEQMRLLGEAPPSELKKAIGNAFRHMGRHFDPHQNRSRHSAWNSYHYCHLYAVERAGMLSGRRELGGKDWYLRCARWLLIRQTESGSWRDRSCMDPEDVLGTCFALLFLKRATHPVVTPAGK